MHCYTSGMPWNIFLQILYLLQGLINLIVESLHDLRGHPARYVELLFLNSAYWYTHPLKKQLMFLSIFSLQYWLTLAIVGAILIVFPVRSLP